MQMKLIFISIALSQNALLALRSSLSLISAGLWFLRSHIRECLKLDQDDKECFSHYKQVKKLSKQLDSAEELIHMERSAGDGDRTCVTRSNLIYD